MPETRTTRALATLVVCLLTCLSVFGSSAPAGTLIPNQAQAAFSTAVNTTTTTVSNTVVVQGQLLESLTLTDSQTQTVRSGATAVFPHLLTNTSNGASDFKIDFQNNPTGPVVRKSGQSNAAFALATLKVYQDLNGNGTLDSSDPEITSGSTVHLDAGQSTGFFVVAVLPNGVAVGSSSTVLLTATSAAQGVTASNTDTIIAAGVIVQLLKSASAATANPNDSVTFTLTASNTGSYSADPTTITVDGVQKSLVVIRDTIPANTSFSKVVDAGGTTALYHIAGDSNPNNYVSLPPADLTTVDAIAFAASNLAGNATAKVSFAVAIHGNAAGAISNVATFGYTDGGTQQTVTSNGVVVQLPAPLPTLSFYDSTWGHTTSVGMVGSPVYIQGVAAACNLNPLVAETKTIRVTTLLTHDDETYTATETGPNTGIFRVGNVPTKDAATNPVVAGDGILEVLRNDKLTATLDCGGIAVVSTFYVDPAGVVFDSHTNAAIANAVVTLIDVDGGGNGGHAGQAAVVLAPDGVTSAPSTVTTGTDGRFQFPNVLPSTYQLQVKVPNGYKVPSTVTPANLPAGHTIDVSGSYLGTFKVDAATGTVIVDVPADSGALGGLFVEKTTTKTVAQIGDFIDYSVQVKNNTGLALPDMTVSDQLPKGLKYVAGTARLDGKPMSDPFVNGLTVTFHFGTMAVDASITFTYRVEVGPGTVIGKVANLAQATSGRAVSNQSRAVTEIQGGVFSDRGYIVGRVTASCPNAGGTKPTGVPGVKVFMEDGTYAITDAAGRYSFYGVRAQTHVLKVDLYTLPRGTHLMATSARSMNDGNSQFVDMKFGELRRADFECDCNAKVKEMVEAKKGKDNNDLANYTKGTFASQVTLAPTVVGVKNTSASATMEKGADGVARTRSGKETLDVSGYPLYAPESGDKKKSISDLQSEVRSDIDDTIGFANLKNGDVLPYAMANIVVKGPTGSKFKLAVNGKDVPEKKVGGRNSVGGRVDTWSYIAVDLQPGHNKLVVSAPDPMGNIRESAIDVIANSGVAKVVLTAPKGNIQADGSTPVRVKVELFDKDGAIFKPEAQVTLEATAGAWLAKDFDSSTPGIQTFISGGKADLLLLAPAEAADARLRVTANGVTSEATISFVPELRPMTAAGVVEYQLNFTHAGSNSIIPADGSEGFEEALRMFSASNNTVSGGSRSAMYLKGKIMGSNLLTMSYDSNKTSGDAMFRDIQPDQFYPVYGDSSTRGFDAQSTSKLYLRIDNGKSYLLYGDFQTSDGAMQRSVTAYSRSLTGMKQHYENGSLAVTSFASYDTSKQVVQEFAANGTSGPYTFQYTNGVDNSEKVELLVRDRNQLSNILKISQMSRFTDYEFEPFTGRLLFKAPVPTLDENMNPLYIRVTYEVNQGGERFWSGGLDSQWKISKRFQIGALAVADSNPQEWYQLYGFNAIAHTSKKGVITAEIANSHDQIAGAGVGYRVEYKEETKKVTGNVYLGRTTAAFTNPSGMLSQGRGEAGGKLQYKIDAKTQIQGEFLRSEDTTTGGSQVGATVSFQRQLFKHFKLKVDLRHAQQSVSPSQQNVLTSSSTLLPSGSSILTPETTTLSGTGPEVAPNSMTTLGAKATVDVPRLHKSTFSAEYEQDLTDADKRRLSLGFSTAVGPHGKVYASHEFISSLGDMYSLNSSQTRTATSIGIDTDYLKHMHLFTEFRQHDELLNRDSEAAIGLRNLFQIRKGLAVTAGFESIHTFTGTNNNSIAVTSGVEFSNSNTRGSARVEWRGSTTSNSFLTSFNLGRQMGTHWTLLSRNVYLHQVTKGVTTGNSDQYRLQGGAAFRGSETSKWDALAMFEYRDQAASGAVTAAQAGRLAIFSTNVNYQPMRGLAFTGQYATKFLSDNTSGLATSSLNQLFSWHLTKDISKKFDVGLVGNMLTNSNMTWRQQGFGAEIGYALKQNLWLSTGYNFLGFYEKELPGGSDARQGAFVRLRFKFDENILKVPGRQQLKAKDKTQDPAQDK
jgi:uncharacterized repeat protein (TIGR01451 family)